MSKPALNVARPNDDGNRQGKTEPEFVPKHRNGVATVSIVGALIVGRNTWHLTFAKRALMYA
jgi:hypothetical protein